MKVTLVNCLELQIFEKAKLISGSKGLENIKAVSFMEKQII